MGLNKREVIKLYQRRAKRYDLTANLYYLIGVPEVSYRKLAVNVLDLHPGDTVIEVGCGTGLNLPYLQAAVGPSGKIIGLDLTDSMLDVAARKVAEKGWSNVELVLTDATKYRFPESTAGILSTFAITLIPKYDQVIKTGARSLKTRGRFVILDIRIPDEYPRWLKQLAIFITKPFGVSFEVAQRRPWESSQRYLKNASRKDLYLGFVYLAVGEA